MKKNSELLEKSENLKVDKAQYKPNLYIIMGETNMKKSSTIRCLTGIHNKNTFDIKHQNGNVKPTFVLASSLQEAKISESDFVVLVNGQKKYHTDICLCLRINPYRPQGSNTTFNSGADYIRYFMNLGWNIVEVVDFQEAKNVITLGNMPQGISTHTIYDTNTKTSNEIAKVIRDNYFKWV
ncbi:MAG: hypothetical protein H9893_03325 [Candidatus Niameybacter stercoravium]|nr:hypothetical protein [Candidatus Niameybacter stercoravium]